MRDYRGAWPFGELLGERAHERIQCASPTIRKADATLFLRLSAVQDPLIEKLFMTSCFWNRKVKLITTHSRLCMVDEL